VRNGISEPFAYTALPMGHWRETRADNAIEQPNREARRRVRTVGIFSDGKSALMLMTPTSSTLSAANGAQDAI